MITNFNDFLNEGLDSKHLDYILDKIAKDGYDSLSNHEKKLLKSYSDDEINVEEEIEKHEKKHKLAKDIIEQVPLKVENHPLEDDIGKYVVLIDDGKSGLVAKYGMIYEIVAIQKMWGHDKNGRYVPNRIGYRLAEVGKENDFGKPSLPEMCHFINLTEEEAMKVNREVHEKIDRELGLND